MRSETAKLLWIMISIAVFLIAVTGTALLTLTGKTSTDIVPDAPYTAGEREDIPADPVDDPAEETAELADENGESPEAEGSETETPDSDPLMSAEEDNETAEEDNSDTRFVDKGERKASTVVNNNTRPAATKPAASVKTPVKPAQTVRTPQPKKVWKELFWIQTGSFSLLSGAERGRDTLKSKGYQASITTTEVKDKTFYRLRVGPFESQSEAEVYLN